MKRVKRWAILALIFGFPLMSGWYLSCADDHEHEEKEWYNKILDRDDDDDHNHEHHGEHHENDPDEERVSPVNNSTYKEECGGCHFAYPPALLPSASWIKILNSLNNHFGEEIEIDPDSKKLILDYLKRNSAENSRAELAVKIVRSLGKRAPLRITDIPCIRKEHHDLPPNVLERESIGSLSNCIACHKRAEEGIFEDDYVSIPR